VKNVVSAWPDHPGYSIDLVPCLGTAVVRVGETVVASSSKALRLIETDHGERLYLPESDVDMSLLDPSERETICPFKGRASYWSVRTAHGKESDLFWTYREPFEEVAGIRGFLGVYQERAEVTVETLWPDGAHSVSRFPIWGDQRDLQQLLDCQSYGNGRFTAPGYHDRRRNVVEGGQLLGQAIVAAARTIQNQRVTWASMTFPRMADFDDPITLSVDQVRSGRTFSSLMVRSEQRGKLVAPSLVLLDTGAPDTIRACDPMPQVPGPDESQPYDMGVSGRALRVVDGNYGLDPDRTGPPEIHAWIRFRDNPDELCVRQALVAQASTHWTIAAGLLPHPGFGEALAHVTLSSAPMALSLSFHDDAPVDEWFLYSTHAIWSGRGLVEGNGRIWTKGGALIASYSLQAMVREMLDHGSSKDSSRVI
jgi:acyl-CoA thioesterase II